SPQRRSADAPAPGAAARAAVPALAARAPTVGVLRRAARPPPGQARLSHPPGLVTYRAVVGATAGAGTAIRSAVRRAVARARSVVPTTPSATTTNPHPITTTHAGRAAAAKSPNDVANCEITRDPSTATPSAEPTCLLVEATPAATPACATGIPDTAAFVIGALISPKPTPNTTYATKSSTSGVLASRGRSRQPPAAIPTPPITRGSRAPRRATIRP